jgi:cell division protein FtsQ
VAETGRGGTPRALAARPPLPSLRVAAIALAVVGLAVGAYLAALETSLFAVRKISIVGGSARVQAQVRKALAPELGRSLLRISSGEVDRRIAAIPDVVSVRVSRLFPDTLRIVVHPEHAVLLLRQGKRSYVISSFGRVMSPVFDPGRSSLPRLWVRKSVPVRLGETLSLYDGKLAAAALAPISSGSFRGGVRMVTSSPSGLTLYLGSGLQIRLGDLGNLRLKLTIARRILQYAAKASASTPPAYVDVSVPARPVLGTILNSQVSGAG